MFAISWWSSDEAVEAGVEALYKLAKLGEEATDNLE
jgi:hypothetical protein